MDQHWYEPKAYGYGAVPIHWKGVAFAVAFMAALLGGLAVIALTLGAAGALPGLIYAAGLTALFLKVCRRRTNGPWRWRESTPSQDAVTRYLSK
ncbi:MAG: hypothetical protein LCH56_02360 [Proteobacteria bacterium]|nr:hypothetical protein [Pseudomonadota bacterium]